MPDNATSRPVTLRRVGWQVALSVATILVLACVVASWVRRNPRPVPLPAVVTSGERAFAEQSFKLQQGRDPGREDLLYWLGNWYISRSRPNDAIACFAEIPLSHSELGRKARFQQGQLLLGLHRANDAEQQFRELFSLEDADPQLEPRFRISARQQFRHILEVELRFEERHALLRRAVERDEADGFETVALLFPSHLRWNNSVGLELLQEFHAVDPSLPALQIALGRFFTVQGRLSEARPLLEQVVQQRPRDLHARAALIACLRTSNAQAELDRRIAELPPMSPDEPWLLLHERGEIALQQNQLAQAAAIFEVIIRQDRTSTHAWQGLVQATRLLGDSPVRTKALKMTAGLGRIQYQISRCLQTPTDPTPFLDVADACAELDLNREGLMLTQFARKLNPSNPRLNALADRFRSQGSTGTDLGLAAKWNSSGVNSKSPHTTDGSPFTVDASEGARPDLKFRDATSDWNLKFIRYDDIRGENRNMEANGGGVAAFDFDLDGRLDLFFTQGGRLPLKKFPQQFSNELFRNTAAPDAGNDGSGHFEQVTASANLTATAFHTGCAVGDLDDDGFPDLYVSSYGRSSIWMNAGDGTFRSTGESSQAIVETWGTSIALADLNGDGWLDIYLAAYLKVADDPPTICSEPGSPTGTTQCSPTMFPALDDFLFVNDGQGGFINVTQDAGITAPDGRGLGVTAIDVNLDGRLDLFVANDLTASFLYVNETSRDQPKLIPGTQIALPQFQERGIEFGVALNGDGAATAAMGIAHGDYDRNGWFDLFVTNFYLEANTLFRNVDGQAFVDQSTFSRLGPPSRNTLAFGTEFLDVDHDGWLDLVETTGHLEDRSWTGSEPHRMKPHLYRNERNGRFSEVAASAGDYFRTTWVGRGLAIGDMDRDGDLDVVVAHQLDPSTLLLNETPASGTSVTIKPVGRAGSPRSGIGARIEAPGLSPVLIQQIAGGGSFQSASAQEFHMPLADKQEFSELKLTWPDGQIDRWTNVTAGHYVAVQGRPLVRIAAH